MFNRVINTKGFWKSVLSLGFAFILLFVIVKWAIEGFTMEYFNSIQNPEATIIGLILGGFIYGFFATFGKFRGKIKKDDLKN